MSINQSWATRVSIALVLLTLFQLAQAGSNSLCTPASYTLGYFNGMWNTDKNADAGLGSLLLVTSSQYNGIPISGEVLYNHTGCGQPGSSCLEDIAEVFEQRAQELDSTGTLGNRLEYFWESIGAGDASLTGQIESLFQGAASLFADLGAKVVTQIAADIAYTLSNPPTAADYAAQNTRLDALATEGQMLLLVGHSQGNMFLNQAYDHILPTVGSSGVDTVQIAPASPTLRGPYLLADIDLVINALRIQGSSTVPANNIVLPVSLSDLTGHALGGTYLDAARPARAQVVGLLNSGFATLVPTANPNAAVGAFTVTLTWSGLGDEDLHVFEPNGSHVFYAAKQGVVGYLDKDNVYGYGPEHYYASCDPAVMQAGTYQVAINNYNQADYEMATVQVATSNAGVLLTKQINTGATIGPSGSVSPIPVLEVMVAKNPTTGAFSYTAQ